MAYRCPNCNRFVSVEPEISDFSLDIEGDELAGDVTINLNCAECNDTMADAELTVYEELPDNVRTHMSDNPDHTVMVDCDVEIGDKYDGAPGTPSRYRRHFYLGEIHAVYTCDKCGDFKEEQDVTVEEQASAFNAMY